jgi:hypothetical protein
MSEPEPRPDADGRDAVIGITRRIVMHEARVTSAALLFVGWMRALRLQSWRVDGGITRVFVT